MMQGYATVNMAGMITSDLEVRYTAAGDAVASFTLAVSRIVKSEFHERKWTDYLDCAIKGDEAEEKAKHFCKGNVVEIFGRLTQQRWEERGYKKSRIVVDVVAIQPVQTMATEGR